MGGGPSELDDLFGGKPRFGKGWEFALLRRSTARGAGSCATRSGAGTTAIGAVCGSEGGEGETQSPRLPLVGADGGVAAMSLVLTSISKLLWGR